MTTHTAPGERDPLSLHGVVPPTITAFDADEALDEETTRAHARFVVDRGVHGVFPLGTNGEFALLTAEEHDRVVEAVVDVVGDEVPVLAGVGAPGTAETIRRARGAEEAGADGIVVVTPYYYPVDDEGMVEHYRRIDEAVDLPFYVYNIPKRTGNAISYEALSGLAEFEGFAGLKDSSGDVGWLGRAIADHPDRTFVAGSDALVYASLAVGCSGAVSAVANVFPDLVVDLYDAVVAGDDERARRLQRRVFDVRRAIKRGPHMSGVKAALDIRGFEVGPLRSPLRGMDDGQRAALRSALLELYGEDELSIGQ